jgi:hypothetical protein
MNLTQFLACTAILVTGVVIRLNPRLLSAIAATYAILAGPVGLFGSAVLLQ